MHTKNAKGNTAANFDKATARNGFVWPTAKDEFVWFMTEKDYTRLKKENKSRTKSAVEKAEGSYGSVQYGQYLFDVTHTLDLQAWYAFANAYLLGVDTGYSEPNAEVPYSLLCDGPIVPIRSRTFRGFQKAFEKNIREYIATKPLLIG